MNEALQTPSRTCLEALVAQWGRARYEEKIQVGHQIMRCVRTGVYEETDPEGAKRQYFVHGAIEHEGRHVVVYSEMPSGPQKHISVRIYDKLTNSQGSRPPRFRLVKDE